MHHYLIALGSNMRHVRHGAPRAVLSAALAMLDAEADIALVATAPIADSRPIGPSQRTFANGAAIIATPLAPPALLARLKAMEAHFGRKRSRRWAARILDLDIILWSGGTWSAPALSIPHPAFRTRAFVLGPAQAIAAHWRDPVSGQKIGQIYHRLKRAKPLDLPPRGR